MIKIPEAVRPLLNLLTAVATGAVLFAGILVIEVLLSGFVLLMGKVPFAAEWMKTATEPLDQGMFWFDVVMGALFLITEAIKLVKGFWKEIVDE